MKHLVRKARQKASLKLQEVRSHRDSRKQAREHRKMRTTLAAEEAKLELSAATSM